VSYWALNAFFLGAVAVVVIVAIATRKPPRWLAMLASAAILLIVSAVFDNIMIGIGLVGYDRSLISGVFVGVAPVEDFAYAVAAVVLLPSLWALLARKGNRA
jgi:lycopene cyclase domain-containing protein